jgi:Flp pilus assembly protein CpaB
VRILRNHPRLPQAAVLALAAITGLTVHAVLDAADAARRRWGEAASVIVALHHLEPGAPLNSTDVELRRLPKAAIPDHALTALPGDAVASSPIERGEIVVAGHLIDHGRVPAGTRAITIGLGDARPPLREGDRVDLIATFDQSQPAVVVATDALVVDVEESTATIAVPMADEGQVAAAARQAAVVVAISATPSRPGSAP